MSMKHETRDIDRPSSKGAQRELAGKFARKAAASVLSTSLTKRGSITQSQADSAVRRYLSESKKK
jgi:hypothetical protein